MNPEQTRKLTARSPRDPIAPQNCWQTPPAVFAKLQADFGPFDIDMMADGDNHLLPDWIGPGSRLGPAHTDVLEWLAGLTSPQCVIKSGFCNPIYKYDVVNVLIRMCSEAAVAHNLATTLLLPLRTTSEWWAYLLAHAEDNEFGAHQIAFCDRRICFYEDGHPRWNVKELAKGHYRADSAVFDSVIVHFERADRRGGASTVFQMWDVPPHIPKSVTVQL